MCFTQIEFMYMKQLEKIARDADAKKPIVKTKAYPNNIIKVDKDKLNNN